METLNNNWTTDYENVLEEIRQNAVIQSINHKKKYFFYKQLHFRIRIPTIILSSLGSVASVGLQSYLSQHHVSAITCLISLLVSIINSIELFLKINETTELELETSKHFYNLATDIHKILSLESKNREDKPQSILDLMYRRYVDLMEKSNLVSGNYKDYLIILPKKNKIVNKIIASASNNQLFSLINSSSNSSTNSSLSNNTSGSEKKSEEEEYYDETL